MQPWCPEILTSYTSPLHLRCVLKGRSDIWTTRNQENASFETVIFLKLAQYCNLKLTNKNIAVHSFVERLLTDSLQIIENSLQLNLPSQLKKIKSHRLPDMFCEITRFQSPSFSSLFHLKIKFHCGCYIQLPGFYLSTRRNKGAAISCMILILEGKHPS